MNPIFQVNTSHAIDLNEIQTLYIEEQGSITGRGPERYLTLKAIVKGREEGVSLEWVTTLPDDGKRERLQEQYNRVKTAWELYRGGKPETTKEEERPLDV